MELAKNIENGFLSKNFSVMYYFIKNFDQIFENFSCSPYNEFHIQWYIFQCLLYL